MRDSNFDCFFFCMVDQGATALTATERLANRREMHRFLEYYATQTQLTSAAVIESLRQSLKPKKNKKKPKRKKKKES